MLARPSQDRLPQRFKGIHAPHKLQGGADMDGGGNNVVAALAEVYVVIGVHGTPQAPCSQRRDHLVGVHVGASTRAGLKYIDRKLVILHALGHSHGRFFDSLR
jgi:hypothetical protein